MPLAVTWSNEQVLLWLVQALLGLVLWLGKLWIAAKFDEVNKRFDSAAADRKDIRDAHERLKVDIDRRRENVDREIVSARELAARHVEDKTQDLWKAHSGLAEQVARISAEHSMQMKLFPRPKWERGES